MSSAATVYQTLNLIAITCAALAGSTAVRRRGNTLTATCAAARAVVMIATYRLHHPAAGLVGGTAIGGVLYLVARWRHWVLPHHRGAWSRI